MAERFEVAAPRPADSDAWRVTLRQLAVLVVVGAAIVASVWMLEGGAAGTGAVPIDGAPAGPAPKVGEPAPELALPRVDGLPMKLSQFKGQPVLINFWATWCPPCRAEIPDLDEVARERVGTGLVVLAVNYQEQPTQVAGYLAQLRVGFTPLLDVDGAAFRQYRINGLPTTYAIDREGVIRDVHVGPMNKRAIESRVAKIT